MILLSNTLLYANSFDEHRFKDCYVTKKVGVAYVI